MAELTGAFVEWAQTPHTLIAGFSLLAYFTYQLFFVETDIVLSSEENTKRGIICASSFFLLYCVLQLRDGHLVRPHPVWWRLITGCVIIYECFLIVLLFQSTDDARRMMRFLDPSLGVPLQDTAYGSDCRIYTPEFPDYFYSKNLYFAFVDRFVIAHSAGWFIGALVIRDWRICWTISILFEFYELSLKHWLPNFNECWWDAVILDVLVCNAAGIYFGSVVCRALEMKSYDWVGFDPAPSTSSGRSRSRSNSSSGVASVGSRMLARLQPVTWMTYDWSVARSPLRFVAVLGLIAANSVMILNSFFLKSVLWIPASHPFNIYRSMLWLNVGVFSVGEYYQFVDAISTGQSSVKQIGPGAWLGLACIATESVLAARHGRFDVFSTPTPDAVVYSWGIAITLLAVGSIIYFSTLSPNPKRVSAAAGVSVASQSPRRSSRVASTFASPRSIGSNNSSDSSRKSQ